MAIGIEYQHIEAVKMFCFCREESFKNKLFAPSLESPQDKSRYLSNCSLHEFFMCGGPSTERDRPSGESLLEQGTSDPNPDSSPYQFVEFLRCSSRRMAIEFQFGPSMRLT